MLAGIERVLMRENPDWVLMYGDTNSTLAGALAAAKLHIPVAHVEAGLRSFNRAMPEEINRILTDHVSALLFCPSEMAVKHLRHEGIERGVHVVGDVMADALFLAVELNKTSAILEKFNLAAGGYWLATAHRAENTDNEERLKSILQAFDLLPGTVIFPVHPRTRSRLECLGYTPPEHVRLLEPLGYLDMALLEKSACAILTDSGGIQKEAYWLGTPCITLRDETEWVETVDSGWNTLVGVDTARILAAAESLRIPQMRPALYGGDGLAADRCLEILEKAG
jgi:UDP-N-acetylglucosamine 2-epimerase